jgi:hypothetical protein
MTSSPGATDESQCYCVPGYGGATCAQCAPGTYSSEGQDRDECVQCPEAGQTSIPGAPSEEYCGCQPGQGSNIDDLNGDCASCPKGYWSSQGVCKLCRDGRTSDVGATDPGQCWCRPGYYGAECLACPAGSFCKGGKDAPLESCGQHRYSYEQAKSFSECFCAAGRPCLPWQGGGLGAILCAIHYSVQGLCKLIGGHPQTRCLCSALHSYSLKHCAHKLSCIIQAHVHKVLLCVSAHRIWRA